MRIASSMVASRSAMLVRWSVRTSRSKTKLMPEARCSTSNTLRTVTSRSSIEIGFRIEGRSCTVTITGFTSLSSMVRCRRRASRCCGFSVSTGRSTSCASRYFPAFTSCSAVATRARWRRSASICASPPVARELLASCVCTRR